LLFEKDVSFLSSPLLLFCLPSPLLLFCYSQRNDFVKRVVGLAAGIGGVLVDDARHLTADSYSVGTVTNVKRVGDFDDAGGDSSSFATFGDHAAAVRYIRDEVENHSPQEGDNPQAEHVVFQYLAESASQRRQKW
jgi:hypothetical protein